MQIFATKPNIVARIERPHEVVEGWFSNELYLHHEYANECGKPIYNQWNDKKCYMEVIFLRASMHYAVMKNECFQQNSSDLKWKHHLSLIGLKMEVERKNLQIKKDRYPRGYFISNATFERKCRT